MPICKTGIPSLTYIDIHRWRERGGKRERDEWLWGVGTERGRDGSVALLNDRKGVAVDHMDDPPGLQEEVPYITLSLSSKRLANVAFKNPNSDHFLSSLVFFPSYLFGFFPLGMCALILPSPFLHLGSFVSTSN